MQEDNLLPCPFCGGKAQLNNWPTRTGYRTPTVSCTRCDAEVTRPESELEPDRLQETVEAWQARTPVSAVGDVREAVDIKALADELWELLMDEGQTTVDQVNCALKVFGPYLLSESPCKK